VGNIFKLGGDDSPGPRLSETVTIGYTIIEGDLVAGWRPTGCREGRTARWIGLFLCREVAGRMRATNCGTGFLRSILFLAYAGPDGS